MAYKLIVTAHAEADVDEHIGYIVEELRNPKAASDLLDAIEKHYDQLEANPLRLRHMPADAAQSP